MSVNALGVALDMGLDATNLSNQSQYSSRDNDDNESHPYLDMGILAATGGSYLTAGILENDPFAKGNKSLMSGMRYKATKAERAKVSRDYFESGTYDAQFKRSAASGRAASLSKIETAAGFETKAEIAYLRSTAAINIGRFAMAANAAFFLAPALFGATYHGFKGIKKLGYELETPKMGGHFTLNNMQATERQRTLSAMHNSEFNGRSAMGQEAMLYHM